MMFARDLLSILKNSKWFCNIYIKHNVVINIKTFLK